jgi:hypothetical protein
MNVNLNAAYSTRFAQSPQESAIIIVGGKASTPQKDTLAGVLNRVALNPQPLPPKPGPDPGPYDKNVLASVLNRVALNPQPLPPKSGTGPRILFG